MKRHLFENPGQVQQLKFVLAASENRMTGWDSKNFVAVFTASNKLEKNQWHSRLINLVSHR